MEKHKEIELKPCPHCVGTDLQVDYNGVYERHFVRCYNHACHMQGPEVYGREKAAEAWNSLPRALVWSSEPPKVPGYYWCRDEKYSSVVEVVQMRDAWGKDSLFLFYPGNDVEAYIPQGREWAGPIQAPQER